MIRRLNRACLALPLLMLGACATTSPLADIETGPVDAAELPALADADMSLLPPPSHTEDAQAWWTLFGDETLNQLVATSQENASDVRFALAQFELALADRRGAKAGLYPTLDLDADIDAFQSDFDGNGFDGSTTLFDSSLALSTRWQIDLFGQARSSLRAAEESAGSAEAFVRDVQRLVTADVVSTYFSLRTVQARKMVTAASIVRRSESRERIEELLARNYGTLVDLRRTESQLFEARAQLAEFEAAEISLSNQLAVLTATPIQDMRALVLEPQELPPVPGRVPAPRLDTVLVQRPDVRGREFALAAAAHDLDASLAARYPSLSLTARLGSDGTELGDVPALDFVSGRFIGRLVAPLLGRGRILAGIDASNAILDRALADYEDTVLRALAEIDTSLTSFVASKERLDFRRQSAEAAKDAAQLSQDLFLAGELGYVSVVLAEDTRNAAEDAELVAQQDALNAYVRYMASAMPAW